MSVVDEKYGVKTRYKFYMNFTKTQMQLDLNRSYRQVALKKNLYATNPEYAREMSDVLERHYESIKKLNQRFLSQTNNNSDDNAPLASCSLKTKVKRSIDTEPNDLMEQSADESNNDRIDIDLDDYSMNKNPENSDATNNFSLLSTAAIITSSTISTALTASNVKSIHHERQGGSAIGTVARSGMQVVIPTVVGALAGVALATGAAWPITLATAGAAVFVGTTLMVTLYYNKFFVAKKLRNIEKSVKKMPPDECFLAQKKALIGLIHHSLAFLNGDKEQGIEKSNTKIKKLGSKILFNLIEMRHTLSSSAFAKSMKGSKEVQKLSKNMNKDINELLEHSVLFSLLINDVKHIKEIYERLNIIKVCEQANTASKKGKLRVALKAVISCIPEKK